MKRKIIKKDLKGHGGLEWLTIKNVPYLEHEKYGLTIHYDVLKVCDLLASLYILEHQDKVPIRGKEVTFIRKSFGLSLMKFAEIFGMSDVGILKWEKEKTNQPLDLLAQVGVRLALADLLKKGIKQASLSKMKPVLFQPKATSLEYRA